MMMCTILPDLNAANPLLDLLLAPPLNAEVDIEEDV